MAHAENHRYIVQVFVGALSAQYEALSVEASKQTSSEEIVCCIADKLNLNDGSGGPYELAEVVGDMVSGECKERRLGPSESPVAVMMLWPNNNSGQYYRFYLREKIPDEPWMENFSVDPQLIKDYFQRFLYQPKDREYPDLCQLPELNEQTLLDNLRARFAAGYIYTYVGSILIALNPFKFYPIYNPKYVKLYQNKRIGSSLPPHIFAVADAAYHCMLRERTNQCIVISGESGSGKTESTNFLLHHLTALSQKGSHGSGVEQTILSAGPVLEAFGNAKTAHNNNSSRFGKFIQVNYKENGMVHGAVVQKYLLEKSRICSQGRNERNYHVFYYLLAGASEQEKEQLHLLSVDKYNYLSKTGCSVVPGVDEQYEFSRLKQSMDMVGFTLDKQRRLFAVLSAVLLLGNVEFQPQRKSYHHDEAVGVRNPEVVSLISSLLRVKQETLLAALTSKRARASGETLVINYRLPEAIATRDAMAKCLYGALFDWIVMQVNHALLSKKDTLREHQGHSIGVLDIFGFEDFGPSNSFEQLCINYANEHLQYYFNQHVFKYEQEEYRREGIRWTDIGFLDNTGCLQLIEGKPGGLLCLLDDQCNFPWATNETLLQKFNSVHEDNTFYEKPQRREPAFVVKHYAGRVKYQVTAMREKNLDLMRQDIVSVLKNSSLAFVRELVGVDPVAVFRWAIVRAFFRGYFAFQEAGRRHRVNRVDGASRVQRVSIQVPNDSIISQLATVSSINLAINRIAKNKSFRPRERAKKGLKNLQSVKTLAGRTAAPAGKRKQPLTVAAQFQHSLAALMETLNQANPFFIRCIKSNSDKVPNVFDEETVQRQLRYTGMLETVRIRQAGYNVRLTYEEFIQLYRILLPKGLLSSQTDVRHFLATLNLDRDNYQLGATKIFMRESEQTKLEYRLHQQIMASIITIQRWFRAVLERRRFLALRRASLIIQGYCRHWLVLRYEAAVRVQAWFRGSRVRRWYVRLRDSVQLFQAAARGFLLRKTLPELRRRITPVRTRHESKPTLDTDGFKTRPPSIEQLKNIIDKQLNMLIQEEAEKTRQLRATQSLPIASLEKKRDNLIECSAAQTYNKRRVSKTQNITELPLKQSNPTLIHQEANESSPDESWNVNTNKYQQGIVAWPNKITAEDLANELLWLRIDQNYLMAEKNKIRERELAESIASSSEEYLRQVGDWSPAESSDTTKSSSRRTSPQVYQRSLSSTTLEPPARALHSLPPVRRDPRDQRDSRDQRDHRDSQRTDTSSDSLCVPMGRTEAPPAPPVRAARRSPRRLPDRVEHEPPPLALPRQPDHLDIKRAASEVSVVGNETLRRRNSDPAPDPRAPVRAAPDYIGHTGNGLFGIAGHRFRKGTRFAKGDKCVYCHQAIDAFITQGQRCIDCKQLYHTKCIQNKGVITMPCPSPVTLASRGRHKNRKRIMLNKESPYNLITDQSKGPVSSNFNLTGTSEFMDRTDKIISDATELQAMQHFITKKIYLMESSENEKQSEVDRVFKHALREFKDNLVATYSVVETRGSALKYKDLIGNFLHVMETVCAREGSTLSITMGVNAFRGFMDEFMSQHDTEKARTKRKKDKKRKVDDPIQYKGHTFILSMINIPTECEICKTFFMWPIERSLICQTCRLASHKKCYMKVNTMCRSDSGTPSAAIVGAVDAGGREQFGVLKRGKVFGIPLSELPTGEGNIPFVVDRLFTTIEMTGLYIEGLYRKSGLSSKVRELRRLLDERPDEGVDRLDSYAVHVRASVLKSFFRELPEPLLTFRLYENFILASKQPSEQTRLNALWEAIHLLPDANFQNLRYLIKFLSALTQNQSTNKMTPSNLAIVIAPNLLWAADESTFDMNITTAVNCGVELLIKHADWFFKDDVNFFISFTKEDLLPDQNDYGFIPTFVQGYNQTAALSQEANGDYSSMSKSMFSYNHQPALRPADPPGRHSRSNSHDTSLILLDNDIKKAQSNSSLSDQSSPPHGSPKPVTRRKNKAPVPPNITPDKNKKEAQIQVTEPPREQQISSKEPEKPAKPPRPVMSETGKIISGVQTINRSTYNQRKAIKEEARSGSRENLSDIRRQSLEFEKDKFDSLRAMENRMEQTLIVKNVTAQSGIVGRMKIVGDGTSGPASLGAEKSDRCVRQVSKPVSNPPPRPIAAPRTILPTSEDTEVQLRNKPAVPERPATLRPQSFRGQRSSLTDASDIAPTVLERTHIYTVDKQHPTVIQVGASDEDTTRGTVQRTHSSGGKDAELDEPKSLTNASRQLSQSEGNITEGPKSPRPQPARPPRPLVPAPPPPVAPASESTDL